jgi:hypothetical protein
MSVQQLVEGCMISTVIFQDKIIEFLDFPKVPEWHEAMVNGSIDIFDMLYEESFSYFNRLENLEKFR